MTPRRIPLDTTVTAPRPGLTRRVHLSTAGVSAVLDVTDGRLPALAHWGAALGPLGAAGLDALCEAAVEPVPQNAVDVPVRVGLLPQQSDGWIGRQGLAGARPDGSSWATRLVTEQILVDGVPLEDAHAETGDAQVRCELADAAQGLAVVLDRSEVHTTELQSREKLVCRLLL